MNTRFVVQWTEVNPVTNYDSPCSQTFPTLEEAEACAEELRSEGYEVTVLREPEL